MRFGKKMMMMMMKEKWNDWFGFPDDSVCNEGLSFSSDWISDMFACTLRWCRMDWIKGCSSSFRWLLIKKESQEMRWSWTDDYSPESLLMLLLMIALGLIVIQSWWSPPTPFLYLWESETWELFLMIEFHGVFVWISFHTPFIRNSDGNQNRPWSGLMQRRRRRMSEPGCDLYHF